MIEMAVHHVGLRTRDATPVVVLRERRGARFLTMRVGTVHANAVMRHSHRIPPFRPQTHEVFVATIRALGAAVAGVYVEALDEEESTAYITLIRGSKTVSLPAAAADAIVLAVWSGAPVFVATGLLERLGEIEPFDGEDKEPPELNQAPVARGEAFRQFINSLNILDDLA